MEEKMNYLVFVRETEFVELGLTESGREDESLGVCVSE